MKNMKYNLSQNFNFIRWAILIVVVSFVAVVSVAKYIQIADLTAITYTALENLYLIMNDPTNMTYIYLPLYLFLTCGVMFDDNFGGIEIVKCGSRKNWLFQKILTLLFLTILFFIMTVGINFYITYQAFPYSQNWSSDFIKMQVLAGQDVQNFVYSPSLVLGLSIFSLFLVYFMIGILSILISLCRDDEAQTLFITLPIGVLVSLAITYFGAMYNKSLELYIYQNIILVFLVTLITLLSFWKVENKDFVLNKKV
ncbi:MAG: hypothetical protein ATN36_05460 [Epulopiscium sp. Nele67-Bin005]|nr:MAG: hypothetical protein ATN36_05460 [Epulopiscium sp. Nele67-Bin005]